MTFFSNSQFLRRNEHVHYYDNLMYKISNENFGKKKKSN